ncbi:hypothetical protein M422DRAFT_264417 [Sphaerobolus stellatus SS14]|uniref:Uncharacterized protein n=1 Tax=Sphaerobolus stellatus (strain SS14) TaxID=990650 RepID=A0A0C9V8J6_SPHS4|nr:hypothetical protein M422DRAFT_264417 [Sphaerobolus stellatus SS14]
MTHTRPSSYPSSSTHLRSSYSLSNIGLDMRTVSSRTEASTLSNAPHATSSSSTLTTSRNPASHCLLNLQRMVRRFNRGEPNVRRAVLVLAWTKMMSTALRRSVNAKMRWREEERRRQVRLVWSTRTLDRYTKEELTEKDKDRVHCWVLDSTPPGSDKKVQRPHTSESCHSTGSPSRVGHAASSSIGNVLRIIGHSDKPLYVLTCEPNSSSFAATMPTSSTPTTSSDTVRVDSFDYGASERDTIREEIRGRSEDLLRAQTLDSLSPFVGGGASALGTTSGASPTTNVDKLSHGQRGLVALRSGGGVSYAGGMGKAGQSYAAELQASLLNPPVEFVFYRSRVT